MIGLADAATQPPARGLRWGIYTRISDDRTGERLGVARQEADVRAMISHIDPHGAIIDLYTDNDTSAYSGRRRPQYERLLADIRSGRINAIGAWHNDRLHRSPRELEDFIELINKNRTQVHTATAGEFDLATASGRTTARILGAVARGESERKAERIVRKHKELAAAGKSTGGGNRPYGYERIYDREERPHKLVREVVKPEEAVHIRDWARRALAGESLSALVLDANSRGIPTSTGGRWSRSTMARLLVSARIAGYREHRPRSRAETTRVVLGDITARGEWPAIISMSDSQRLRRLLTDPSRRTSTGPNGRYLCSGGILECSQCERALVGRARGAQHRRLYMCNTDKSHHGVACGKISIDGADTDAVIVAWVVEALCGGQLRPAWARQGEPGTDDDVLLAEIAECERELEELAEDRGNRLMSRAEWLTARQPVLDRKAKAEGLLAAAGDAHTMDGVPGERVALAAFLTDLDVPVTRRRAVVRLALDKVVVQPGVPGRARFDPERLEPVWR